MLSQTIDWRHVLGPLASPVGVTGCELKELQAAVYEYPPKAIRLRPELSPEELPFATQPVPWLKRGHFVVDASPKAATRPGGFLQATAGDYTIQDAGSMLALALCELQPGQRVCDICAAPGGKSTGLLEALAGTGLLVSNEVIASRLGILELALARAAYGNHLLANMDAERLASSLGPSFDCVLVDAPCTGQTLVARGKQSLAAFSPQQIEHSSRRQQRILKAAAGLTRAGGRLVYSTCAFSYAENEQVVLDFLEQHPDWQMRQVAKLDTWQSPIAAGCYRLWPHRDRCAGAFAALLERTAEDAGNIARHSRRPSPRNIRPWRTVEALPSELTWLTQNQPCQWWQSKHQLHRFDHAFPAEWLQCAAAGTHVASSKTSRWEPAYPGAILSDSLLSAPSSIDLNDELASRFVAGESLHGGPHFMDLSNPRPNEWCVVKWRGRTLSWGKLTGRTLKNHFPKLLRQQHLRW